MSPASVLSTLDSLFLSHLVGVGGENRGDCVGADGGVMCFGRAMDGRPAAYADADACIKISPKNSRGYLRYVQPTSTSLEKPVPWVFPFSHHPSSLSLTPAYHKFVLTCCYTWGLCGG